MAGKRPDFSKYDLLTFEGRKAAMTELMSWRAAPGESSVSDIETLEPELISYEEGDIATVHVRPKEWMLNGLEYVQGGFLASIIDVVCGPMSAVCANGKTAGTLDMTTTYFRPITMKDEYMTVIVKLTSNTKRVMHFEVELLNSKGKTAVTAITNIMKAAE